MNEGNQNTAPGNPHHTWQTGDCAGKEATPQPREILLSFSELLHQASQSRTVSSRRNRKYALVCLRQYLGVDPFPLSALTRDVLEDYIVWLSKAGKSLATIELYRKELRTVLCDAVPSRADALKELFRRDKVTWNARKDGLTLEALRQLARTEFGAMVQWTRARDLYLASFYCGGADFATLQQLTADDVRDGYLHLPGGLQVRVNANLHVLLDEYRVDDDPRLFPFAARWTDDRYREHLKQIAGRYRYKSLLQRDSAIKTWITLARELGVEFPVMAVCAAKRLGILSNYTQTLPVSQADIDRAINRVSTAVADLTDHWYAMRLRPGKSPEDIYQRLQDHPEHAALRTLTLYYPCEDITRRVGKKFVKQAKAYIERVLFFRTKPYQVATYYALTADLGWIYRQVNTPSAPYAVIPQQEMTNFQSAVSRFTPDISFSIVRKDEVMVGKRVKLLAGQFAGCEGYIVDEKDDPASDLRSFAIAFTSENALKVELRLLETEVEVVE